MMSAPFYKVSILTFSPCGGFFPHPTTDYETATTGNERQRLWEEITVALPREMGAETGDDKTTDIEGRG